MSAPIHHADENEIAPTSEKPAKRIVIAHRTRAFDVTASAVIPADEQLQTGRIEREVKP